MNEVDKVKLERIVKKIERFAQLAGELSIDIDKLPNRVDINDFIVESYPFSECFTDKSLAIEAWSEEVTRQFERQTRSVCDLTMNELVELLDKRYKKQ